MDPNYLDFEQPIAELEAKISELRLVGSDNDLNIGEEIQNLRAKSTKLTEKIYSNLSSWQISQVARHPQRPYTLDYLEHIFTDFDELHGDRLFADDQALIGGLAKIDGRPCVVMGHQKGRGTKAKVQHNFGMPRPEGYRKLVDSLSSVSATSCLFLALSIPPEPIPALIRKSAALTRQSLPTWQ